MHINLIPFNCFYIRFEATQTNLCLRGVREKFPSNHGSEVSVDEHMADNDPNPPYINSIDLASLSSWKYFLQDFLEKRHYF
jgi:hypothetical protein